MTLANGSQLIAAGLVFLTTNLPFWDGISAYELIIAMILLTIIGNFIARMIKGKSHSEHAVQAEDKGIDEYPDDKYEFSLPNGTNAIEDNLEPYGADADIFDA